MVKSLILANEVNGRTSSPVQPVNNENIWWDKGEGMKIQATALSHTGRVRKKNEDNLYFDGSVLPQRHDRTGTPLSCKKALGKALFGVFDGMGGYSNGEQASYLAATIAKEKMQKCKDMPPAQMMVQVCHEANNAVCEAMEQTQTRMGTTAAMVYLNNKKATVCNIGDSPIFLLREGKLSTLHQEHSERATYEMVTGKKASPKKKFRLTQNIGIFKDEMLIEPYFADVEVEAGDLILICSDGVTDMVSDEQIAQILNGSGSLEEKAQTLLDTALENGGRDNITLICIRLENDRALGKRGFVALGAVALAVVLAIGALGFGLGRPRQAPNSAGCWAWNMQTQLETTGHGLSDRIREWKIRGYAVIEASRKRLQILQDTEETGEQTEQDADLEQSPEAAPSDPTNPVLPEEPATDPAAPVMPEEPATDPVVPETPDDTKPEPTTPENPTDTSGTDTEETMTE